MGNFSAGSVISRSFGIWFQNFIPFTVLSLLCYLPLIILNFVMLSGEPTASTFQMAGYIQTVLGMVLSLIATGAMTFGVFQQLRGQRASIGACISAGIGRLLPVLGVGILSGLAIIAGCLALVVPGVIVACMLWVAVPVAVVERTGTFAALRRSSDLTKGYKGSVFGVLLVIGLIAIVVGFVLRMVVLGTGAHTVDALRNYSIVSTVVSAVLGTLSSVAAAVGYHDLRVAKDGVATEDLARVFD